MPNTKQYFLHALNLAMLSILLLFELALLTGRQVLLKYWVEYHVEFPILISLTIVCIVNTLIELRKYLNG